MSRIQRKWGNREIGNLKCININKENKNFGKTGHLQYMNNREKKKGDKDKGGENRDNIAIMENGESEENIDQREYNYCQNWSTDTSMHSLHRLVRSKDVLFLLGCTFLYKW